MSSEKKAEISPDELMESFRGRSLKSIILFTVVVHAVLLLGTSVPFLIKMVTGKDTTELDEEERLKLAMDEATSSLQEIAEEYGLNPRDLSRNFAGGTKSATKKPGQDKPGTSPEGKPLPGAQPKPGPGEPPLDSPLKEEIRVKKEGPKAPPVDDDEDLFK
ncbi:MAG: hypothetical protein PVJ98_02255 [Akkermansiaceae bacterium]|jgi:hypothetical protein